MLKLPTKYFVLLILLFINTSSLFAQGSSYEIEKELDEILMKNDLLEIIKEAEKSQSNNLPSIYRRLILYRKAANYDKVSQLIKQIPQIRKQNATRFSEGATVHKTLGDKLFKDVIKTPFAYGKYVQILTEEI